MNVRHSSSLVLTISLILGVNPFFVQQSGQWQGSFRDTTVHFQLAVSGEQGSTAKTFELAYEVLPGLEAATAQTGSHPVQFRLTRDAGTLLFDGSVSGGIGNGSFILHPIAGFVDRMNNLGYEDVSEHELLLLAAMDVNAQFVEEIHDVGYDHLSLGDIIKLKVFEVDPQKLGALAEFGYTDIEASEFIQLAKVNLGLLQALIDNGFAMPSLSGVATLSFWGVTPEYIRELASYRYTYFNTNEISMLSREKVPLDYLRALSEVGYGDFEAKEYQKLHMFKVEPALINELNQMGMTNLSSQELLRIKMLGLEASMLINGN